MIGALASFAALAVAIRELSDRMGAFEILFFRSLIGIVAVAAVARLSSGVWSSLWSGQFRWQVVRNVVHYGGQLGWTIGVALLPLATVFALEFTVPLWSALLAAVFLGERMNRGRAVSLVFGLVGILVVVRPGAEIVSPVALIVLGAALCFAAAHITTKRLTRTDSSLAVLFWMSVLQAPMGLFPAIAEWVQPTLSDVLPLLGVGFSALAAHYCLTNALRLADATVVLPLDFLRLPLIAVVGFLLYAEPLDPFVLGGGAIIFLGTVYGVRFEARRTAAAHLATENPGRIA